MKKKFTRRYPKRKRYKVVSANVLLNGPKEHIDLTPEIKEAANMPHTRGGRG